MIRLCLFLFCLLHPARSLSVVGRFSFVFWMVLLRGLDYVESRPEVAPAKPVVGGCKVVVVVAFSGACYAGVVAADRMMATRVAVCSHVACGFERALVSVAASAAVAATAAASTAAAATTAAIVLFCCCCDCC